MTETIELHVKDVKRTERLRKGTKIVSEKPAIVERPKQTVLIGKRPAISLVSDLRADRKDEEMPRTGQRSPVIIVGKLFLSEVVPFTFIIKRIKTLRLENRLVDKVPGPVNFQVDFYLRVSQTD